MKKKRDRAYYRDRLVKEHPALYSKVRSGSLSVQAASAKAGLIHLPSRVDALKREWKKATNAQQVEFVTWLKASAAKRIPKPIADSSGQLRREVRAFLDEWIKNHKYKPGRIMKEIGFAGFDWTLSAAIERGYPLRPDVIPPLTIWLRAQGFRG